MFMYVFSTFVAVRLYNILCNIFGALGAYEKRVWHIIEAFNFEGTLIVPHTFEALNGKGVAL
jgi:hypothetical protein